MFRSPYPDEGLPAKDVEAMRGFRCHRIHVPKRICEIGPVHAPVVARIGATVAWSDLARPHFLLRDIRGNKGQQQELVALDGPEASAATDSVD